ncbi:hypothetical protein Slala05_68790 [Streptomyces lavendulae subsp. lavendulae]|nr:hypothetical protein Slala05_68790 [Streptomyces lavendulae subsp. lavendulae]
MPWLRGRFTELPGGKADAVGPRHIDALYHRRCTPFAPGQTIEPAFETGLLVDNTALSSDLAQGLAAAADGDPFHREAGRSGKTVRRG